MIGRCLTNNDLRMVLDNRNKKSYGEDVRLRELQCKFLKLEKGHGMRPSNGHGRASPSEKVVYELFLCKSCFSKSLCVKSLELAEGGLNANYYILNFLANNNKLIFQ